MRKIRLILTLAAIMATQSVLADDVSSMPMDLGNNKPCAIIAKACMAAGFSRADSTNKRFWFDCMKPIISGKKVSGVSIDPAMVKACRTGKIKELQMELKELEKAN